MSTDPNSFDQEFKDGKQPNPQNTDPGTGGDTTPPNTTPDAGQDVDYKTKFAESSKEALRLLEEKKKADEENARLKAELAAKGTTPPVDTGVPIENLYPGFENLEPEAQQNLIVYADTITKRATDALLKNPAIAAAVNAHNESRWTAAFNKIAEKHPELRNSAEEFKSKYYNPQNVPENIETILTDVSKIYLFDKAKEIGAEEERQKAERIELEQATGGDRTPTASRTLADWQRMQQENPAKFASLSKEYHADLASGKLQE